MIPGEGSPSIRVVQRACPGRIWSMNCQSPVLGKGMRVSPLPQPVNVPLTRAALFLVATINPGADPCASVRSLCGDLASLVRAVGFRAADASLSCVLGIGSEAWDRLFGPPRPLQLHPFREIRAAGRHAVATPGDLLLHIRSQHFDLCFELVTQIVARLGDSISVVDEVHGFRYFDARDLLGFVDGTENPTGPAAMDATLVVCGGECRVCRRKLRNRAEIPPRSGGVERAPHRGARAHHRPRQAVGHRNG